MELDDEGPEVAGHSLGAPSWITRLLVAIVVWIAIAAWRIHGYGDYGWIGSVAFAIAITLGIAAFLGFVVTIGRWLFPTEN